MFARMCLLATVTSFAGVTGCDTGAAARPERPRAREIESGGRLVARRWVVGRHEVFRDFFDRAIGEACSFVENVGPGPRYRCLPLASARHGEGQGPYLDAECKEPAALPSSTPGAYAIVERKNACADERVVYRAGPVETRRAFTIDAGKCVPLASTPVKIQRLERAIDNAAFVRGAPAFEERGVRIAMQSLVGEDGARQPFDAFDLVRREPVVVDVAEDGERRFRPLRVAFVGAGRPLFSDDACTVEVATKIGRDAACPLSAALVFQGLCGRHVLRALTGTIASLRGRDEKGACGPTASEHSLAFGIGERIAPEVLAPATRVEIEGGPVRRRAYLGPDGAVATWGELVDVRTNEPCTVVRASDDVDRCLPAQSASAGYFADETCSAPAIRVALTGCETEAFPTHVRVDDPATLTARAFTVTPIEAVYALEGGKCRVAKLVENERVFGLTEVGAGVFPPANARED